MLSGLALATISAVGSPSSTPQAAPPVARRRVSRRTFGVLLVVVMVVVAGLSVFWYEYRPGGPLNPYTGKVGETPVPITVGSALYTENLSGYFGAVGEFGTAVPSPTLTTLTDYTAINVFRFGDGMDSTNLSLGVSYSNNGVAGPIAVNVTSDWKFCESLTPKCVYIAQLPGETNSPGDVLSAVSYLRSHGIDPNYYSIGNEPSAWFHFAIRWTSWSSSDDSSPTATQYAREVQRMIPIVRSVVPDAKIIGLEDNQCANDSFVQQVAKVDGANISAIACHAYSANSQDKRGAGLQQFYNTLSSNGTNLATNVPKVRDGITYGCPTCSVAAWVDEFNAIGGPVPAGFNAYMSSYPDFVLTAGSAVRGMTVNLTHYLFFAYWPSGLQHYAIVTTNYSVRPTFYWYSYFAPNITSGQLYSVRYAPPYEPSFATYLQGPSPEGSGSLVVVNANATVSENISISLPLPLSNGGKAVYWGNTTSIPTVTPYGWLPANYTLGPASVLLVDVNGSLGQSSTYADLAVSALPRGSTVPNWEVTLPNFPHGLRFTVITLLGQDAGRACSVPPRLPTSNGTLGSLAGPGLAGIGRAYSQSVEDRAERMRSAIRSNRRERSA